jgi:exodeoxyribonuclease VII large subunit
VQLKLEDWRSGPPAGTQLYTVSQIVHLAGNQLEARFGDIWVEGEVSNLRCPSSGHLYFTLKDTRAQLAVVMFRSAAIRLPFSVEDGLKIRCRGALAIWDAQGKFQLNAESAEPAGAGAQQLALEQLQRKLEAEGLFDVERKRPLPMLPRAIAVVTSPTGAALRDIIRMLHDRCPVRIVVSPTAVQGSEAPAAIVSALRLADRHGVDLIILGRGGGSAEDLSAFNTEVVARAIAATRTPVISAVGHEIDVTIADRVADCRAPTPTAAAELAVPLMAELLQQLQQVKLRLERAARAKIRERALSLERMRRRLGTPLARLSQGRLTLDDVQGRLESALLRLLRLRREHLARWTARLAAEEPRLRLARRRSALESAQARLVHATLRRFDRCRGALDRARSRLDDLSPIAVLSRGYGLVLSPDRSVLRDLSSLRAGDPLIVRLQQGEILCRVVETRRTPER